MRLCLFVLLVLTLLSLSTLSLFAQWQATNGPYGGIVYSLASNSTQLFAGSAGRGVYRSLDNGATGASRNRNEQYRQLTLLQTDAISSAERNSQQNSDGGTSWS
jgi:hypothetical protein